MIEPVATDIEHVDLDEDGEDIPQTMVHVWITTPEGMRYSGSVACDGEAQGHALAGMILNAAGGAATSHSPELGEMIRNRVRR